MSSVSESDRAYRVRWKAMRGESHAPLLARVCQKGIAPDDAIVFQPRPKSPETGLLSNPFDTWLQTAKIWLGTENPAIWIVSCPNVPAAAPEPYWILKGLVPFWKVDDCTELNVGTEAQPVIQDESATQRSLDWRQYRLQHNTGSNHSRGSCI
jgi:hypothetical protein